MKRKLTSVEAWGVLVFSILAIVVLPSLNAILDSSYSTKDIKDVSGLVTKLTKQSDPVSEFVWQQIPSEDQDTLSDAKSTPDEKKTVLSSSFNRLVQGDLIWDDDRFAGVKLSPDTLSLKSQTPEGEKLKWLNRKLLDDSYPAELKKARYIALPGFLQVSNYTINLYGKFLCYAILAIGVDLLWGYTGLLSLGQCLYFSLGGYMMGMYLMRMIGTLGTYKMPIPDFLCMQGWTTLPWIWKPFSSFPFALLMVFLLPSLLSLAFGYLAFRSRIKGVYFSILTQALTYAATILFFRNQILLGGNNGLNDFKFMLGYDVRLASTQRVLYICSAVALLAVYLVCKWLTGTKYGKIQRAIRDSENRVLFSGYSTANFKLFIFVFCSLISALAGMLYVPQVGSINPSEMATDKSIEAVLWVAVGGRGTLIGPVIGAIFVNALKSWATHEYPDLWLFILGGLFIIVVLFMPGGIVGLPAQVREYLKKRRKAVDPETAKPVEPAKTTAKTPVSSAPQG